MIWKRYCDKIFNKRGTLGFVVLDNFSRRISVILISKCNIAVFSEPAGCGFLAFWTVWKIILLVLWRFPSLFQFLTGHSQGNLAFMVTVNYNSLHRNSKRVRYILLINWEWGHYREISDRGLDVLTQRLQGQYIKTEVWDFLVMTEWTRLRSYLFYGFFRAILKKNTMKTQLKMPGHYKKIMPAQQPIRARVLL